MENCSVPQSNGLRLSIQLCSTNQAFFPFFFFHSEREESTHAHSEQFGYQYSNNRSFDSSLQICIVSGIGPNNIQICCWTLSNFIVNEIRQGEEGKIFQSKKKVTIYSGNKRKVKENWQCFSH